MRKIPVKKPHNSKIFKLTQNRTTQKIFNKAAGTKFTMKKLKFDPPTLTLGFNSTHSYWKSEIHNIKNSNRCLQMFDNHLFQA